MNAPTSSGAPSIPGNWPGDEAVCATCPFWCRNQQDDSPIPKGECRADPPKLHMLLIPAAPAKAIMTNGSGAGAPQIMGQTAFPVAMADCWCGAHPLRQIEEEPEGSTH